MPHSQAYPNKSREKVSCQSVQVVFRARDAGALLESTQTPTGALGFDMDPHEPTISATKGPASRMQKGKPDLSAAGRFNAEMMRRLAIELERNPETDICTFLSLRYSKKLRTLKGNNSSQPLITLLIILMQVLLRLQRSLLSVQHLSLAMFDLG